MVEANIYYINLDRCRDRREAMESSFFDDLIRVPAIDGFVWTTGEVDSNGKYCWKKTVKDDFLKYKILPTSLKKCVGMSPMEVACNFSHIRALRTFLCTNNDYGIILEDDVEPIKQGSLLDYIKFPLQGDILYLCGPKHPGDRLRLYDDRQVKWARTLMGYVVSRKAAKLMIRAAFPMCYLMDTQIMVRLYKSLEQFKKNWVSPELEELDRFKAYGLLDPLIQHSKYAKITTFTKDGTKPWLPDEAQL